MIGFVLARRYAKALIDLAGEAGQVAEVGEELAKVSAVFDLSPELVNLFADPTVRPEKKEKVLGELLGKGGTRDLTRRFLNLLLAKGRLTGLKEITESYRSLADKLENRVRARIVSAVALEEEEVDRVRNILSGISGKEVVLELEVDESLLGGMVTLLGSEVYDGSLRNQLQQVKENLSKGR